MRASSFIRLTSAAALALAAHGSATLSAQSSAPPSPCVSAATLARGADDLYCIDLLPAAGVDAAIGSARLLPASSPFGLAVSPAGESQWDVAFDVTGLPSPGSLGAYTTYVAWATTPQLKPVVRLGEIANGRRVLGRVTFDRFLLLITAEPSPAVAERSGRVVLRGTSASMRMQPHDMAFLLAGLLERRGSAAHVHDSAAAAAGSWTPPPMHPQVAMPPALMTLRPAVSSYLPSPSASVRAARPRELLRPRGGDTIRLEAGAVRRQLFGRAITMLGFNGQYPGPLIEVTEASTLVLRFVNHTEFPTAIHWHGVRLDNRFDGVPHVTQPPVAPSDSFDYRVRFPDPGIYWYHPHHREDVLQDLGLYGNLFVRAREPDFFGPANREEILMLDDFLLGDAGPTGYGREAPTHALMGRFGNVLLVNGEPRWRSSVRRGEVVRLFLTNASSTRVFNLSFGGRVRMKVVASDLGRYERESWVENVVIAPAERYVIDARFEDAGEIPLLNRVRAIDHIFARFFEETDTLGVVRVTADAAQPDFSTTFSKLRENAAVVADIARYQPHVTRPADHELTVVLETRELPFPLTPLLSFESVYRNPVEWSGTMPEMDWIATGAQVRWILRERSTGRENMDIDWRFRVGDVVRLRLVNDRGALHAMQHPIHIHGQRFLVLSVNGVENTNRVWKDTVLLPTGFVAELLVEMSNPGRWMLHCHVSEHIETGMRMVFEVRE